MKWIALIALAFAVLATACGDDDDKASDDGGLTTVVAGFDASETANGTTPTGGSTSQTGGAPTAPPSATTAPAPTQTGGTKTYSAKPPLTIDANKKYFATIKMDIGDIKIELYPKDAPESVNSFVFLARDGYYDGITFHRVIAGFVAQAGDPKGTGSGGPGYTIPDEVNKNKFIDGAVGMAKTSAPNSAGSQFFICFAPQPNLDGGYTVFGQVVEGRDVLDKIMERDPSLAGPPGTVMNTIEIEEQ